MLERIRNHPFVAGIIISSVVWLTLGGVIGRAFLVVTGKNETYLNGRITELGEARRSLDDRAKGIATLETSNQLLEYKLGESRTQLASLEEQIAKYRELQLEDKYAAERARVRSLSAQVEDLKLSKDQETDRLRRRNDDLRKEVSALRAELARLPALQEEGISGSLAAVDTLVAEKLDLQQKVEGLVGELESCKDSRMEQEHQLSLTKNELREVRLIVSGIKPSEIEEFGERSQALESLMVALRGLSNDVEAGNTLLRNIGKVKGGVTPEEWIALLRAANISDDYCYAQVIAKSVKHVSEKPSPKQIQTILSSMHNDSYESQVYGFLQGID